MPLTERGLGLALFVAALFMVAGCVVASNVITGSFRQTYVPAGMLGRVSACDMTISYAMMPVGALLAGILGQSAGVRTTLWLMAGGMTACGLVYLLSPMRGIRDLPDSQADNLPAGS